MVSRKASKKANTRSDSTAMSSQGSVGKVVESSTSSGGKPDADIQEMVVGQWLTGLSTNLGEAGHGEPSLFLGAGLHGVGLAVWKVGDVGSLFNLSRLRTFHSHGLFHTLMGGRGGKLR